MELMSFLFRAVTLTLLAALPTVHASPAIIVPSNMTANEVYDIKIDQRIAPDEEVRKRANAYRVYLALTPPGWGTGAVCWLVNLVDLDTTQVNITIPADVAPDKSRIRISTGLIKKGAPRSQGFSYSSKTTFLGANGTWSQRELNGQEIADDEEVSCWAYGCARTCHEQYDTISEDKAYACVKQCAKDLNPRSNGSANAMSMLKVVVVGVVVGFLHIL